MSTALVSLHAVRARDHQGAAGRALGRLSGVSVALGAGVHAVLGRPADGTVALCEALSGERRPAAGEVRVLGIDPARSAALRQRIGTLPPSPTLGSLGTVAKAVALAARIRGGGADALARLGLEALAARPLASLSLAQARAVELGVALATPRPVLLVLYEPWSAVAHADAAAVRERVRALAADGVAVLIVTSAVADLDALAGSVHVLHAGALVHSGPWRCARGVGAADGAAGAHHELTVWLADADGSAARLLCEALGREPGLGAVGWRRAGASSAVTVQAPGLEQLALVVTDACARLDAPVSSLSSEPPTIEMLLAEAFERASAGVAEGGR